MYHQDENDGHRQLGRGSNHSGNGAAQQALHHSTGQFDHRPRQSQNLESNSQSFDHLNFMRQNDPNSSGGSHNETWDTAAAGQSGRRVYFGNDNANAPEPGRRSVSMLIGGGSSTGSGGSRRGIDTSSLSPPGRARQAGLQPPEMSGVARQPAVGVGIIEHAPAGVAGVASAPNNGPHGSQNDGDGARFLHAPYQNMFQKENAEDPTVTLARSLKDNRKQSIRQPRPTAGKPIEPNMTPIKPEIPTPRLGRRIVTQRKRIQDIHKAIPIGPAEIQQLRVQMEQTQKVVVCVLNCHDCSATLKVKKGAILIHCPRCDKTSQSSICTSFQGR